MAENLGNCTFRFAKMYFSFWRLYILGLVRILLTCNVGNSSVSVILQNKGLRILQLWNKARNAFVCKTRALLPDMMQNYIFTPNIQNNSGPNLQKGKNILMNSNNPSLISRYFIIPL